LPESPDKARRFLSRAQAQASNCVASHRGSGAAFLCPAPDAAIRTVCGIDGSARGFPSARSVEMNRGRAHFLYEPSLTFTVNLSPATRNNLALSDPNPLPPRASPLAHSDFLPSPNSVTGPGDKSSRVASTRCTDNSQRGASRL